MKMKNYAQKSNLLSGPTHVSFHYGFSIGWREWGRKGHMINSSILLFFFLLFVLFRRYTNAPCG